MEMEQGPPEGVERAPVASWPSGDDAKGMAGCGVSTKGPCLQSMASFSLAIDWRRRDQGIVVWLVHTCQLLQSRTCGPGSHLPQLAFPNDCPSFAPRFHPRLHSKALRRSSLVCSSGCVCTPYMSRGSAVPFCGQNCDCRRAVEHGTIIRGTGHKGVQDLLEWNEARLVVRRHRE